MPATACPPTAAQEVVLGLLRDSVLGRSPLALEALAAAPGDAASAFQRGFRECLARVERIKARPARARATDACASRAHGWRLAGEEAFAR
jgi:hypothetical protein